MAEDSLQYRFMRYLHQMDFQSQKSAEKLYKALIVSVAIISYLIGWQLQRFSVCVYSTLAAMIVCFIVVVPGQAPWWRKPFPAFQPNSQRPHSKKE